MYKIYIKGKNATISRTAKLLEDISLNSNSKIEGKWNLEEENLDQNTIHSKNPETDRNTFKIET